MKALDRLEQRRRGRELSTSPSPRPDPRRVAQEMMCRYLRQLGIELPQVYLPIATLRSILPSSTRVMSAAEVNILVAEAI